MVPRFFNQLFQIDPATLRDYPHSEISFNKRVFLFVRLRFQISLQIVFCPFLLPKLHFAFPKNLFDLQRIKQLHPEAFFQFGIGFQQLGIQLIDEPAFGEPPENYRIYHARSYLRGFYLLGIVEHKTAFAGFLQFMNQQTAREPLSDDEVINFHRKLRQRNFGNVQPLKLDFNQHWQMV